MYVPTTKSIKHGYCNHWHDSFSYVATMFNIFMAKNNFFLSEPISKRQVINISC